MSSTPRKEQIIETAARLFSQRGYHATSMRDLARELDLKGASLYSHISGKEEILWLILERAARQFLDAIEPIAASDMPPLEKLRAAIRSHVRVVTGDLAAATVYFHEWKALQGERRAQFLEWRRRYEHLLQGIVEEGMAAGVLDPHADPKFATLLILSVVNWLYQWYRPEGPLSPDEIAERFTALILDGLGARVGEETADAAYQTA